MGLEDRKCIDEATEDGANVVDEESRYTYL